MKAKKIAVGVGIAGGALLATLLLSRSRRDRSKQVFTKKLSRAKRKHEKHISENESVALYI